MSRFTEAEEASHRALLEFFAQVRYEVKDENPFASAETQRIALHHIVRYVNRCEKDLEASQPTFGRGKG